MRSWGQSGGKWAELDQLDEEVEAAAAAASSTFVAPGAAPVGAVEAPSATAGRPGAGADARDAAQPAGDGWGGGDGVSRISAGVQAIDLSQSPGVAGGLSCSEGGGSGSDVGDGVAEAAGRNSDAHMSGDESHEGGDGEGGDWETAGSSRNAERRRKKKVRLCLCVGASLLHDGVRSAGASVLHVVPAWAGLVACCPKAAWCGRQQ